VFNQRVQPAMMRHSPGPSRGRSNAASTQQAAIQFARVNSRPNVPPLAPGLFRRRLPRDAVEKVADRLFPV